MSSLGRAFSWFVFLAALGGLPAGALAQQPSDAASMLRTIDSRQDAAGDLKSLVSLEFRPGDGGPNVLFEVLVIRRSAEGKVVMLWTKPKEHSGKGYLRLIPNMWFYDTNTGRWERRTDRTRLNGTDTRRADLDAWRLSSDYEATDEGEDKVGAVPARKLLLKAKPGLDLAYPMMRLWVDKDLNPLKRQDLALSGKLLRTTYFPTWRKFYSEAKKGDLWMYEQMIIYDEVTRSSTVVVVKSVDFAPVEPSTFTKAWLESRSR
ncbi:outer membrane lipoprotein-sorting protein [Myxococcaceae bacterium GXIMD 01537]